MTTHSEVNFRFLPYNHSKVSGGKKLLIKILTFCLHCSNVKAYTYYIVHTLRSRKTIHLIFFSEKMSAVHPPAPLLLGTARLLIFKFFWETTEKYVRYVIPNVSTGVSNQNFFQTSWTTSWMSVCENKHCVIWKKHCCNDQLTQREKNVFK